MKRRVDVSILSANYNNELFLEDFFNSIINSTVKPAELIMVEDGSQDGSLEIIDSYSHLEFLQIIRHSERKGLSISLNEGISGASGRYIMRLDPDDFITGDRIETQFNFLEKNKEIDIVGSNVFYYNDVSKKVTFKSKFPVSARDIYDQYHSGYHGLVHSSVMGRSAVMKAYKFSQESFPAEEYELFSRMSLQNVNMANIPRPLTYYRIHKQNINREKVKASVRLTLSLRESLFEASMSRPGTWIRIQHLYFYRRALGAGNRLSRLLFFAISIIFSPGKLIKRLY